MKINFLSVLGAVFTLLFLVFAFSPLYAGGNEVEKVNDAIKVLEEIMEIPEQGIPPALLNDSHGIAIIPGVIKAGFIIGGRHGRGVVVLRDGEVWSNPSFVSITGGSIGWQIGAESIDVILVFKSKRSIDNMIKGKFTLGADASIAAGPVGRQAEAATDVTLKAEIYSYSRSRGLFAGISLEGAALSIDEEANADFYGRKEVHAGDIFEGRVKAPPVAESLKAALRKYTQ
jgi:lipid-binding SYLF domain-containing protein